MSTLGNLKLVASKPVRHQPVAVIRRKKLADKIGEQIEMATAIRDNRAFTPMLTKTVTDSETGERRTVNVPKRLKTWWWETDSGKLNLSLRYGAKIVELAKGKTAVELDNQSALLDTLALLRQAVIDGELDAQIEAVCGGVSGILCKRGLS